MSISLSDCDTNLEEDQSSNIHMLGSKGADFLGWGEADGLLRGFGGEGMLADIFGRASRAFQPSLWPLSQSTSAL